MPGLEADEKPDPLNCLFTGLIEAIPDDGRDPVMGRGPPRLEAAS